MEKPEWTFWSTQYNHVPMSPQLTASASAPSLSYYPCGNSVSPPGCLFLTSSLLNPQVSFFLRFYPSLLVAPPSTYGTLQNSRHHSWTPQFQHLISIRFTCKIHPGLDHISPPVLSLLQFKPLLSLPWTTAPGSESVSLLVFVPSHGLLSAEQSEASLWNVSYIWSLSCLQPPVYLVWWPRPWVLVPVYLSDLISYGAFMAHSGFAVAVPGQMSQPSLLLLTRDALALDLQLPASYQSSLCSSFISSLGFSLNLLSKVILQYPGS